jgi:enterobactin synthetase component D
VTLPERWRDAAPARVASFAAGRHCARAALARAGALDTRAPGSAAKAATPATTQLPAPVTDTTLGAWPTGAARWPAGFVGSITHTADRAIAVVASDQRLRAIGIDCERIMDATTADDVAAHIVPELDALLAGAGLADVEGRPLVTTLVFSAKECLYKALHPLVDEFFDFTDVRAERLDMTSHTLDLRLLRPLGREPGRRRNGAAFDAGTSFTARFALMPREIVTLLELPIVPSAEQDATSRASDHLNRNSGSPSRTPMPSRRHAAP